MIPIGNFIVSRWIVCTFLIIAPCTIMPIQLFGQQVYEVRGGRLKHIQFYYEKGLDALDSNRYQDAIEYFDKCLKYDPYALEPYFLRAMAKENIGDKDGALTDYNIILHMIPEHVEALFGRGLLYYHMERYEFAETDFEHLVVTPVNETAAVFFKFSNYESGVIGVMSMEAKEAEAYNYLGLIRSKLGKHQKAIEDFNKAISLYPGDPNFHINRGLAFERNDQLEQAKSDYRRALEIDDTNILAKYNSLRLSDDKESIALYDDLIDGNNLIAEPIAQRGLAKFNIGDYQGALKYYNMALAIDDSNYEFYLNRGMIKEKLRNLIGAINDYTNAIRLKPDFAKAHLNRGNVYVKQRKYKEAISDYSQAIIFDRNNSLTFYNRGVAKYNLKDYSAACDDVTHALEMGLISAGKAVDAMCNKRR
ncbi:MAG: tetratricopeptide repeat protein [Bacteroidetes bacterium]|nr:tetratricopeptide repeat protein [Bacteroidota bacterium]